MKKILVLLLIVSLFASLFASMITIKFEKTLCCCVDTYVTPQSETVSVSPYTTSLTLLLNE